MCLETQCILHQTFQPPISFHYNVVIMSAMASQITSLTIVSSTVYSGTDERKHQSPASLAFVSGIHRWPLNSPHKGPVTRKMFPFHDVIMLYGYLWIVVFHEQLSTAIKLQCHEYCNIVILFLHSPTLWKGTYTFTIPSDEKWIWKNQGFEYYNAFPACLREIEF